MSRARRRASNALRLVEAVIPSDRKGQEDAVAALTERLTALPDVGCAQIWVYRERSSALGALLNGGQGWLMLIRHDGDPGFSSRNPGYTGPPEAEVEYTLGNGQVDSYPAAWAFPRADVLEAIRSFARTGRVNGISWDNDSGDGSQYLF